MDVLWPPHEALYMQWYQFYMLTRSPSARIFSATRSIEAIFGPKHPQNGLSVWGQKHRFAARNDHCAAFWPPWGEPLCRHFGFCAGSD